MQSQTTSRAVLALLLAAAASITACGSASPSGAAAEGDESATTNTPDEQDLASATIAGPKTGSEPQTLRGVVTTASKGAGKGNSGADIGPADSGEDIAPTAAAPAPGAPPSAERQVVAKLGLGSRFLIGLGNDATGDDANQTHTYGLGHKLDIHYMYLSGLDWPEWDAPAGNYVTLQANAARSHGIVPMFTLYQAASYGENNLAAFDTTAFMTKYWRGVRLVFQHLGAFGSPAIVHVEPDLWGYTQAHAALPSGTPMKVGSIVPECSDLPSDVSGMAKCVIRLSRQLAPKVVIGLSASTFGAFTNGYSDPVKIGNYMKAIGADLADITVVETLDRDAGCFENGSDGNCKRAGKFYWDESNVAHPNFHDHLAWAKTIRSTVGKPLLWWQMPLGVPANTAGYSSHYRDNRVRYLFSHPGEFAAAGGIGAVFGTGADHQTNAATDNNQFKTAVGGYYAAPATLP
ncbi:MAG: hypothetical protein JWP87_4297 [Labilithrix sp.]|nr:hypothetical protein [Labilithrix sp.]